MCAIHPNLQFLNQLWFYINFASVSNLYLAKVFRKRYFYSKILLCPIEMVDRFHLKFSLISTSKLKLSTFFGFSVELLDRNSKYHFAEVDL